MKLYKSILMAFITIIYFESKFIPLWWARILVFLLFFILMLFWTQHREQQLTIQLQQLITALQSGKEMPDFSGNADDQFSKYSMPLLKSFKQKLRKNNFAIQVAAGQISASSQQLSFTLSESNTFARQLSAEAQDMIQVNDRSQKSLANAIASLKELVATLESSNNISQNVQKASLESEKNINSGLTQIMDIVTGVKQVEDSTLDAVASINQFQETFRAISGSLDAVDTIANQTQLLALNASIEAARAGEHGAGFGIVAQEVRTLSENSKLAVSEISGLVMKMTQEIRTITETMKRNRGYVQNCADLSRSVETGLTLISESQGMVQELMQESLQVAGKQYEYAVDIGRQVDVVEQSFQQANNRFADISLAIAKQNGNLVDLESLAQNLTDAEKGLSGLITSESNLMDENQQALQSLANDALQVLNKKSAELEFNSQTQCKTFLDRVLSENDFMEAVWLNNSNGDFIYSNPPAQIANAKVREWFKRAMNGEKYVSTVYISAITNAPCLTVSLPINDQAGKIMGVIGADIKIAV